MCVYALHFLCIYIKIKRETRSHYHCPVASGLELEFEDGTGTRSSHWVKRVVEVMSIHSSQPVMSHNDYDSMLCISKKVIQVGL